MEIKKPDGLNETFCGPKRTFVFSGKGSLGWATALSGFIALLTAGPLAYSAFNSENLGNHPVGLFALTPGVLILYVGLTQIVNRPAISIDENRLESTSGAIPTLSGYHIKIPRTAVAALQTIKYGEKEAQYGIVAHLKEGGGRILLRGCEQPEEAKYFCQACQTAWGLDTSEADEQHSALALTLAERARDVDNSKGPKIYGVVFSLMMALASTQSDVGRPDPTERSIGCVITGGLALAFLVGGFSAARRAKTESEGAAYFFLGSLAGGLSLAIFGAFARQRPVCIVVMLIVAAMNAIGVRKPVADF